MDSTDILPLPQRRLGRTGAKVSAIGLGGAGLNGGYGRTVDDAAAVACVRRALELGVTLIDTSPLYGESERRIGLALEPGDRDRVFLASKTGTGSHPKDYSRDGTFRSVERSLQRLRTDRLDLMQIHDPDDLEPALAPGGALDALLQLKEEGVIGAIGLGVRSHGFLLRAIRHGAFDTILTYADFNLVRQSARETLFPEAAARDVSILLGSPLLFGYLSDRPWTDLLREHGSSGEGEDERRALAVREWAEARGISVLNLALQFCLREPRIGTILVGATSAEEIEQNVRAAAAPLPDQIWNDLEKELEVRASNEASNLQ